APPPALAAAVVVRLVVVLFQVLEVLRLAHRGLPPSPPGVRSYLAPGRSGRGPVLHLHEGLLDAQSGREPRTQRPDLLVDLLRAHGARHAPRLDRPPEEAGDGPLGS